MDFYDYEEGAILDIISKIILSTSPLSNGRYSVYGDKTKLEKHIILADNAIINDTMDVEKLIDYENGIMREYQHVPYGIYKENRIHFLETYKDKEYISDNGIKNIDLIIDYVSKRRIKIGLYCGSFNPLHVGHIDIIKQGEEVFDKVIIGLGTNPDKPKREVGVYSHHEIIKYEGLTTDLITDLEKSGRDITLIRGLRDSYDLHYESKQIEWMRSMKPDLKHVMILCKKEYSHISSSSIRSLKGLNVDMSEYIY